MGFVANWLALSENTGNGISFSFLGTEECHSFPQESLSETAEVQWVLTYFSTSSFSSVCLLCPHSLSLVFA